MMSTDEKIVVKRIAMHIFFVAALNVFIDDEKNVHK